MNLSELINKTVKFVKSNSPEILTALSISGVVTTSYLVGKASFKASERFKDKLIDPEKAPIKDKIKVSWKLYIPSGISGALTIGCIIGASQVTGDRTMAAITAYSLTEKAFTEYKEAVVKEIGEGKEQKIRDQIAQDRVYGLPPCSNDVVIIGDGKVLCCELFTHRYFRSDMESLRKAQNILNDRIIKDVYVTLEEFYDLIGLSSTSVSNRIGWDSDKLMELEFSTVLSPEGEPCLAFDYSYTKPLR